MKYDSLLEEIYDKYKQKMFRQAFDILRNKEIAEDIVHDSFLKINEKINKKEIKNCHKLDSLIGYIVKGLAIDYIRKNEKHIIREIEDNEITADDVYVFEDEAKEWISKLPEKYRKIIYLRFIDSLEYSEISKITGTKEPTLRKQIERGKIKLKKLLRKRVKRMFKKVSDDEIKSMLFIKSDKIGDETIEEHIFSQRHENRMEALFESAKKHEEEKRNINIRKKTIFSFLMATVISVIIVIGPNKVLSSSEIIVSYIIQNFKKYSLVKIETPKENPKAPTIKISVKDEFELKEKVTMENYLEHKYKNVDNDYIDGSI